MNLPLMILSYLILIICVMVSVAFVTLLERKVLGYIQLRKGPNKLLFLGLFQPLADSVKLFWKEKSMNYSLNKNLFKIFPFFSLFLMVVLWLIFNWKNKSLMNFSILFFLIISSLNVYVVLGSGWVSNSKYALLGAYRGVAQMISYEVSMAFMILSLSMTSNSLNFFELILTNEIGLKLILPLFFFFFMWGLIMIAELNRAPFDFAEGESELVSGFNVEYGASNFALLFLSEYGNIIFISFFSSSMFFNSSIFFMMFLLVLIIWLRGTYPRFRYDNLMMLTWKMILPFSIFFLWGLVMLFFF